MTPHPDTAPVATRAAAQVAGGVSVVIPTYNTLPYLKQTLESVLAQTHAPLEVLVVDDGSTDGTPDVAQAFGEPVRVIRQQNRGVCRARNRGFQASRGEFVCFLDHDDYWYPWKLALQLQALQSHPEVAVVFTDFKPWLPQNGAFADPRELGSAQAPALDIDPDLSGWIYHRLLLTCWALTSTTLIRRSAFEQVGGFDEALPYAEDWDLWLRLCRQHQFLRLRAASTLYRQHPNQGNRKLRDIDYRSELLESASRRWGLRSADGRSIDAKVFHERLARYHMQFGLHHLNDAHVRVALRSFWRAWRHHPTNLKYPAFALASLLGWKPRQYDPRGTV
jgi:glycosyltransferase involved in cell wall biosynthesis